MHSLLLLVCVLASPGAAATLASISADGAGVPRQLQLIDSQTGSVSSPFALGDAGHAFTGGLAWSPGAQRYFTIYEDAGQSVLASFDLAGGGSLLNAALALDAGVWRGLTFDPSSDTFYALYSAWFGPWELRQINVGAGSVTPLFSGPAAGFGGMTYVQPGQLTALFTNGGGEYQLHAIDVTAQTITPFGASFPMNMNGGLAWDSSTGTRYFAIGSDNQGASSLYSIAADGNAYQSPFGVGGGYFYAALSGGGSAAQPAAIPEPSTLLLVGAAGSLLVWRARRR